MFLCLTGVPDSGLTTRDNTCRVNKGNEVLDQIDTCLLIVHKAAMINQLTGD